MENEEKETLAVDTSSLRKALASAAEDICNRKEGVAKAVATEVVKYLSKEIEMSNLADMMLTPDKLELDEVPKYIYDGELNAYIHAPGSYAPITQPRNQEMTVSPELISCHVMLPLHQLRAGRYGSIEDQMRKAKRAILGKQNKIVLDTMVAAVPSTTTLGNYTSVGGALTSTALNTSINYIEDQQDGGRAIVGRRSKLYGTNNWGEKAYLYSDSMKDEIMKRGGMAVYRGLPLLGFKQYNTPEGAKTLAETSVFTLGYDVGKAITWGDFDSEEQIDVGTLNWHIHVFGFFNCIVTHPEKVYRLLVT